VDYVVATPLGIGNLRSRPQCTLQAVAHYVA